MLFSQRLKIRLFERRCLVPKVNLKVFLVYYLGKVQKLNLLISIWGTASSSILFVLSSQNGLLC